MVLLIGKSSHKKWPPINPGRFSTPEFEHGGMWDSLERSNLTQKLFREKEKYLSKRNLIVSSGRIIDTTIVAAPGSTRNQAQKRLGVDGIPTQLRKLIEDNLRGQVPSALII